jgi:hypothetical protein
LGTLGQKDVQRLSALGLLSPQQALSMSGSTLAGVCAKGGLLGGLSVALDVRPDELVGPLCQRLGGEALRLRILEVRTSPQELWVLREGKEWHWPVPDVPALVDALNLAYRRVPAVRAIALLGKSEDAWQLWCLEKDRLPLLLDGGLLEAENVDQLSALGAGLG